MAMLGRRDGRPCTKLEASRWFPILYLRPNPPGVGVVTMTASPGSGKVWSQARSVSSEATESLVVGKIATTAALTMSGITLETPAIARLLLATYGTAGQDYDEIWQFDGEALLPGELFALTAPQAFDAAGTWQASIKGFGFEVKVP